MKEKIIDGVNVAECISYAHQQRSGKYEITYNYCLETKKCCGSKDNYNCLFKQLQRLKQENKELASNYENLYRSAKQLYNKYNKFDGKKENELVALIDRIANLANKYKQALEETREVLKYYANSWINPLQYPDLHYDNKKAKDTLLKIDEILRGTK